MEEENKNFETLGIVLIVVLISAIIIVAVQNNMKRRPVTLDISTSEAFASVINEMNSVGANPCVRPADPPAAVPASDGDKLQPSYSQVTAKSVTDETTTELITAAPLPETTTEPYYEDVCYEDDDSSHGSYIGYFRLTAYEWTGSPMANGEYPYYGAVACNSLPLGTVIYIGGYGTFVVKDRGGMADNVIDIYLGDPYECEQFGRRGADVYYG